jgi:DNA-binding transcriptional ArsR family regulator
MLVSKVPPGYRALTEPAELHAIADPLRRRLLSALRTGPASATALARGLGEPVSRVHRHLQVLLRAGLVRRADDIRHGRTRERQFALVDQYLWVPHELFEGGEGAGDAWRQLAARIEDEVATWGEALSEARERGPDVGETWQEADLHVSPAVAPYLPALIAGFVRTLESLGEGSDPAYHLVVAVRRERRSTGKGAP